MSDVASLERCRELYELSGVIALPVIGLEDRFIVTEGGVVISLPSRTGKGKVRTPYTNKEGYLYISYKDTDGKQCKFAVHRAVAQAFLPYAVNHEGKTLYQVVADNPQLLLGEGKK